MPLDQMHSLTIDTRYATGSAETPGTDFYGNPVAACCTAEVGKGRSFFLPSGRNLDLQPALRKALFAGIRWVMLK